MGKSTKSKKRLFIAGLLIVIVSLVILALAYNSFFSLTGNPIEVGPGYKSPTSDNSYESPTTGPGYVAPKIDESWEPPKEGPGFLKPEVGPGFQKPQIGEGYERIGTYNVSFNE